jgi:hypothetical protein
MREENARVAMFFAESEPAMSHRASLWSWLIAVLAVAALEGCEHGNLSFDHSSGIFMLPIGAESHGSPNQQLETGS